jgi:uncharacterized protein
MIKFINGARPWYINLSIFSLVFAGKIVTPWQSEKLKSLSVHTTLMKDPISKELYDILACPACKSDVRYNKAKTGLVCIKCKRMYPIKDGIPIMLVED